MAWESDGWATKHASAAAGERAVVDHRDGVAQLVQLHRVKPMESGEDRSWTTPVASVVRWRRALGRHRPDRSRRRLPRRAVRQGRLRHRHPAAGRGRCPGHRRRRLAPAGDRSRHPRRLPPLPARSGYRRPARSSAGAWPSACRRRSSARSPPAGSPAAPSWCCHRRPGRPDRPAHPRAPGRTPRWSSTTCAPRPAARRGGRDRRAARPGCSPTPAGSSWCRSTWPCSSCRSRPRWRARWPSPRCWPSPAPSCTPRSATSTGAVTGVFASGLDPAVRASAPAPRCGCSSARLERIYGAGLLALGRRLPPDPVADRGQPAVGRAGRAGDRRPGRGRQPGLGGRGAARRPGHPPGRPDPPPPTVVDETGPAQPPPTSLLPAGDRGA